MPLGDFPHLAGNLYGLSRGMCPSKPHLRATANNANNSKESSLSQSKGHFTHRLGSVSLCPAPRPLSLPPNKPLPFPNTSLAPKTTT